jgi:hypothetical protein
MRIALGSDQIGFECTVFGNFVGMTPRHFQRSAANEAGGMYGPGFTTISSALPLTTYSPKLSGVQNRQQKVERTQGGLGVE